MTVQNLPPVTTVGLDGANTLTGTPDALTPRKRATFDVKTDFKHARPVLVPGMTNGASYTLAQATPVPARPAAQATATPETAPPTPPTLALTPDDAELLRTKLSAWTDRTAVSNADATQVKGILLHDPALKDATNITLVHSPGAPGGSALDARGNFEGRIENPDGGYTRFFGRLQPNGVSLRVGGTYGADKEPVLTEAQEQGIGKSLLATLNAQDADRKELLAAGGNGDGGFVVLERKGEFQLFEGPANGEAWKRNTDVEHLPLTQGDFFRVKPTVSGGPLGAEIAGIERTSIGDPDPKLTYRGEKAETFGAHVKNRFVGAPPQGYTEDEFNKLVDRTLTEPAKEFSVKDRNVLEIYFRNNGDQALVAALQVHRSGGKTVSSGIKGGSMMAYNLELGAQGPQEIADRNTAEQVQLRMNLLSRQIAGAYAPGESPPRDVGTYFSKGYFIYGTLPDRLPQ